MGNRWRISLVAAHPRPSNVRQRHCFTWLFNSLGHHGLSAFRSLERARLVTGIPRAPTGWATAAAAAKTIFPSLSGRSIRGVPQTKTIHPMHPNSISTMLLLFSIVGVFHTPRIARAEETWVDVTKPLLQRLKVHDVETAWPGGCSGVVVNRLTGDVTIKVVGEGLWQSKDHGTTWNRVDEKTVSGRDETGWATSVDQNAPERIASFSLDGTAGWTPDGKTWQKFTDLGRNWDYGSVDWSAENPMTIIAAKHETDPPGEVYASTDGGVTWKQLPIHVKEDRGRISMIGTLGETSFIYSIGEGIHRSTDSGKSWSQVSEANPQTRIPVFFQGTYYLGTATGLLGTAQELVQIVRLNRRVTRVVPFGKF